MSEAELISDSVVAPVTADSGFLAEWFGWLETALARLSDSRPGRLRPSAPKPPTRSASRRVTPSHNRA